MPGRDHCGKLNLLRTDAVWFTWNKKSEVSWDRRKNRLQKAICRRTRKRGVCFTNKKAEVHEACWAEAKGKRGETICSVQFCYRHRQTANKHRERQILWREDVLIVTGLDKECTVRQPLLALPVCVCVFFFSGEKAHWIDVERIFERLQQQWLIPTNPSWFHLHLSGCRLGRVRMRWEAECSRRSLFLEVCLFSELLPDGVTDWVESYCHLLLFTLAESLLKCRKGFGRVALFDMKKWRSCSSFQKHQGKPNVECFLNVH